MLKNSTNRVCAVIVTYHPEMEVFLKLIKALEYQVAAIVVVDNSEIGQLEASIKPQASEVPIHIMTLNQNIGVAAAHNRGIVWAQQHNFEYVILFDQDSCPAENMVTELLMNYLELINQGRKVAIVGPCFMDVRVSLMMPFNKLLGCRMKKISSPVQSQKYCETSFLITSGSLMAINTFNKIGYFDESLFIDYVDTEWCLRAVTEGYCCFGIFTAILYHRLGDEIINFFGLPIPRRSSLRQYYLIRNAINLYKRKYLTVCWKINDAVRLLAKFFIYAFLVPSRRKNLKMMILGFFHGLLGRNGRYEGITSDE